MEKDEAKFISMEKLCKRIDTPKKTIENWIRNGEFVPGLLFVGRSKRFDVKELNIFDDGIRAQRNRKELVKEIVDARPKASKG